MPRKMFTICVLLFLSVVGLARISPAAISQQHVNARSAILIDMDRGAVLFEQNADMPIAPASITKILTLYLVFEAIKEGQVRLSDKVEISRRAASTGGSRMGLRANTRVPLEELIKGMAVVSGNDACVAAAEHISGSVERFVRKMNIKARELGMTSSRFMTPNGLPASGQLTTARDISRLSVAYLRKFPESLTIHSMTAYSYGKSSHHNANRLLGKCPGVDGLKTGFVCASGYNISATAKRSGVRVLAVVMGARNPWIRCSEAERLIEIAFREAGAPYNDLKCAINAPPARSGAVASIKKNSKRASIRSAKVRKKEAVVVRTRAKVSGNAKAQVSSSTVQSGKKQARSGAVTAKQGKVSGKVKESAQVTAKKGKSKQTVAAGKVGTKFSEMKQAKTAAKKNSKRASIRSAKAEKKEAVVVRTRRASAGGNAKAQVSSNAAQSGKKQARSGAVVTAKQGKVSSKVKESAQVTAKKGKSKQTMAAGKAGVKSSETKQAKAAAKPSDKKLKSGKSKKEEPKAVTKKNSAVPHAKASKKHNAG